MRHVAAAIVVLLCTTLSGCVSCDCGRGLDAGTDAAGPEADADAGTPQCPDPLLLWDGLGPPPGNPIAGLYPNETLDGYFLLTWGENIGPFSRLLQIGTDVDSWPRVPFSTLRHTATSFGDGSILVLGSMSGIGPDGILHEEVHVARLTPTELMWAFRVAPVGLPNDSGFRGWPTRLDDGSIAFGYGYWDPGSGASRNRHAVYDYDGPLVEYETDFVCSPTTHTCADDGEGGGWRVVSDAGDPPQYYLQHFAVDGAPLQPEPGVELAPPHELNAPFAVLRHPAGGGILLYLFPLDPSEPGGTDEETPRGVFVQRFDGDGTILWDRRIDDADGPKGHTWRFHAVHSSGRVVTSWLDYTDGDDYASRRCFLRTLDGDGTPLSAALEMEGAYGGGGPCGGLPALAHPDDDGIFALWTTQTVGGETMLQVWAMRFDWALVPQWPEPLRLNCPEYITDPILLSDGAGGGLGAWFDGDDRNLYLVRVRADGTTGWYDE